MTTRELIEAVREPTPITDGSGWIYRSDHDALRAATEAVLREVIALCPEGGGCDGSGREIVTDPRVSDATMPCRFCANARALLEKVRT